MLKRQIAALKAELEATEKAGKTASKGSTKALASAKASLASTAGSKAGKKRAASDAAGSSPAAKKKAPAPKKAKASGSGAQAAASAAEEPKQPKAHKKKAAPKKAGGGGGGEEEEVRVVSYHQKEELAAKITQLPDERLEGALRIIAEDKPQTSADDEEIELDIDDLSPRTLYRLYRYVVKPKVKKAPTGKAAADGRKRGTGGVKRKNLDEGEEAARILKLQEQLMQFDNAEAGELCGRRPRALQLLMPTACPQAALLSPQRRRKQAHTTTTSRAAPRRSRTASRTASTSEHVWPLPRACLLLALRLVQLHRGAEPRAKQPPLSSFTPSSSIPRTSTPLHLLSPVSPCTLLEKGSWAISSICPRLSRAHDRMSPCAQGRLSLRLLRHSLEQRS
jgi:bromodomain-containing factor 1